MSTDTPESLRPRAGRHADVAQRLHQLLQECHTRDDLIESLRELLEAGGLPAGYRLPSMRKLQEISGLRQHDVYRALEVLAREGWIEQRRGSGTFVLGGNGRGARRGSDSLRIGVIPPSWDPAVSHHAVAMFLTGITAQAGIRHQVQLVPARLPEEMPMDFVDHVRAMGLEGLIWVKPPVAPPPALVQLLAADVPVVVLGRSYAHLPVPMVNYDHAVMGEEVARYLVRKNRSKLLCMAGVQNDQLTVDQLVALRAALERHGLALPDDQIVTVRVASAARVYSVDLRSTVLDFLKRHADFDAVFTAYSDQFDTLTEIHESGFRRCPDDFIHIHHGSLNVWAGQQWPPFPTAFLSAPSEAVGRQGVKELEKRVGVETDHQPEDLGPRIEYDPYPDEATASSPEGSAFSR